MTNTAPGQSAPQQEPVCYNCGAKGHWVVACPEPTRPVPAGLQQWQSQHQERGRSERNATSQEKKGPVVTRYPHPPAQGPFPSQYGQPAPPGFPPAVHPPPPPPQSYPQPGYAPVQYAESYAAPPGPPPPPYGPYSAPVPPPTAHYGQQPPYGPPQYPASYPAAPTYYPGAPSLPPPPAPPSAPPPPFPPGTYPPHQYAPPPPPPPPPGTGAYPNPYPPAPPPPGGYPYPPGQPPAYGPSPPAGSPYPPAPGWSPSQYGPPPPPPPSANQTPLGTHRGKHQKNLASKRPPNRDRHRSGHEKSGKNVSSRGERQQERRPKQDEPHSETKDSEAMPREVETECDGEWDPGSEADLKRVFPEIKVKPADPVGIPLPFEYTDDPTIPPAYNATCIKSEFFREDNKDEFASSVRLSRHWNTLKNDPAFRHYPGMAMRRFAGSEHEYPTYEPADPPAASATIKMPPRYQIDRSALKGTPQKNPRDQDSNDRRHSYTPHYSPAGRRPHDLGRARQDRDDWEDRRHWKRSLDGSPEDDRDERKHKRRRWSNSQRDRSRDAYDRTSPPRRRSPSPRFNIEGDPWSPQAGESMRASSGRGYKSPSSREERVSYADKRHDSGYYSGDKAVRSYRDDDRGRRPPSRSYHRRRTPSRSRSRSRSRGSSPGRSHRGRSESPLTALEAELLGLTEEPSEPKPKPKVAVKKPIKKVKVAAAFGRRW